MGKQIEEFWNNKPSAGGLVGRLVACLVLWLVLPYVVEEPHPIMIIGLAAATGVNVLAWALWTFWTATDDFVE